MSTFDPPPASPSGEPTEACANCGAPVRPDQDWCLNCGAALSTRVAQTPNWRTPLAIVGVILALVAAGIVVAFLELSDDADDDVAAVATATTQTTATTPPVVGPSGPSGPSGPLGPSGPSGPTGAGATGPTGTQTFPTITSTTPGTSSLPTVTSPLPGTETTPGTGTTGGTVASWPSGEEAWTVILVSSRSRSAAEDRARELSRGGTTTGVLDSDEYEGLRGGYWVVFSGQYESRSQAQSEAQRLRSRVPGAYVRYINPR